MPKPQRLAITRPQRILPPNGDGTPLKLNLGCGDTRVEGHVGIDIAKTDAADYVLDLRATPWPIDDEAVDGIFTSHFMEHLAGLERIPFMEECWRVLKPGAQMTVIVPYWSSMRSIQDPSHAWPPLCEASFLYFNRGWRETNRLTHGIYAMKCSFGFSYGYGLDADVQPRNAEFQQMAVKNYLNAALDLHVTLTKEP